MVTIFEKLDRGRQPAAEEKIQPLRKEPTSAQKLLNWLQRWEKNTVALRDICIYGPKSIRDKKSAVIAAEVLVEFGWLTPQKTRAYNHRVWQIVRKPIVGPSVAAETTNLDPQLAQPVAR